MSSYFPGQKILQLKENEFTMDSELKIGIKEKILTFALFVDDSTTSHKLQDVWASLSKSIAGAKFGVCELLTESNVAEAFSTLANDNNSEYKNFATDTPPFILCYRNGFPKEKYDGVTTEYELRHWCLQNVSGTNKNHYMKDSSHKKKENKEDKSNDDNDDDLPTKI